MEGQGEKLLSGITAGLLSLTVLFIGGCEEKARVGPSQGDGGSSGTLIPLSLGNWWTYRYTITIDDINLLDTLITNTIDTFLVLGTVTWFGSQGDSAFIRNGSQGLYQLTMSGQDTTETLLFKYPSSPGESWTVVIGESWGRGELVERALTVNVPAGTFTQVLHYRIRFGDDYTDFWIKPGVGTVKLSSPLDLAAMTSQLVRYNIRGEG